MRQAGEASAVGGGGGAAGQFPLAPCSPGPLQLPLLRGPPGSGEPLRTPWVRESILQLRPVGPGHFLPYVATSPRPPHAGAQPGERAGWDRAVALPLGPPGTHLPPGCPSGDTQPLAGWVCSLNSSTLPRPREERLSWHSGTLTLLLHLGGWGPRVVGTRAPPSCPQSCMVAAGGGAEGMPP